MGWKKYARVVAISCLWPMVLGLPTSQLRAPGCSLPLPLARGYAVQGDRQHLAPFFGIRGGDGGGGKKKPRKSSSAKVEGEKQVQDESEESSEANNVASLASRLASGGSSWDLHAHAAIVEEQEREERQSASKSRNAGGDAILTPPPATAVLRLPRVCFALLMLVGILKFGGEMQLDGVPVPAAKRCLAILVCVSTLWATEAIPMYITSLLVPILVVATQALLPAQVLLFMAGFSIGSVLEKQRLSNIIASVLLTPFGNKPENVLLGIMSLGCFLSMWISNVPSAVLCVSLAQPIIAQLPLDDPFAKALLIGIAISNNIGGMTTPISSPPNVIALNWCEQAGAGVSFGAWLSVTMPFCSLLLLASWAIIRARYPPKLLRLKMSELTCKQPPMTRDQILALVVTTGTVVAWAFWKQLRLERFFGHMGLVGLVPITIFFTAGLLDRNDFHNTLNWSVLILIGGGLALGHVMERSFLLQIFSKEVERLLVGASMWVLNLAFCLVMAVVGNFVSSTVAAIVLLPVVASVGKSVGKANLMILTSVIMDSAAMALPVSSFPNANSFAVQRTVKRRGLDALWHHGEETEKVSILTVQDYIVTGGLVMLVALVLLNTFGYFLLQKFV